MYDGSDRLYDMSDWVELHPTFYPLNTVILSKANQIASMNFDDEIPELDLCQISHECAALRSNEGGLVNQDPPIQCVMFSSCDVF